MDMRTEGISHMSESMYGLEKCRSEVVGQTFVVDLDSKRHGTLISWVYRPIVIDSQSEENEIGGDKHMEIWRFYSVVPHKQQFSRLDGRALTRDYNFFRESFTIWLASGSSMGRMAGESDEKTVSYLSTRAFARNYGIPRRNSELALIPTRNDRLSAIMLLTRLRIKRTGILLQLRCQFSALTSSKLPYMLSIIELILLGDTSSEVDSGKACVILLSRESIPVLSLVGDSRAVNR